MKAQAPERIYILQVTGLVNPTNFTGSVLLVKSNFFDSGYGKVLEKKGSMVY